MTTNATHPTAQEVSEDAGLLPLTAMSVDGLTSLRESYAVQIRELQDAKGTVEQELWRRAKLARPEVETAGTMVLAGEASMLTVGADRTWEWDEKELLALQGAKDAQGNLLLTDVEYGQLVTWVAKVNGNYYNSLIKRGGFVEEVLTRCRTLKSARPTFTAKARA